LISAPSSGQGKTTVTAALARLHHNAGLRVRVFKCGPDFLDPTILAAACGSPVHQLDLWMVGEENCRDLLWQAAGEADLIIVEGVMGLFDGSPSAADLAELFSLPVLAVIDAKAMAQTFAAVAFGLSRFRPSLAFAGALANRVAGDHHAKLIKDSLPPELTWRGALRRQDELELPSRHLGLVQASELTDLDRRLNLAAEQLAEQGVATMPREVEFFKSGATAPPKALSGVKIAIARDAAFSFIYQANIDLLEAMGAQLLFFSPINGDGLPTCDSLYLPGGYPELHLDSLADNRLLIDDILLHQSQNKPILAECGGLLYLLESLSYGQKRRRMVGLLPARAELTGKLMGLGLMSAQLPEGTLRGHCFHHSTLSTDLSPLTFGVRHDGRNQLGEAVYRLKRLTATYIHFYFPSNWQACAALFAR
jgi:cobyrinic acid a,c-diamide synthase